MVAIKTGLTNDVKFVLSMLPQRLGLIIGSELHADIGNNICGPCCISVPEWVVGRLRKILSVFC